MIESVPVGPAEHSPRDSPQARTAAWKAGHPLRWHSSHRVLGDLVLGDRLWVVTSGKALAEIKVSGQKLRCQESIAVHLAKALPFRFLTPYGCLTSYGCTSLVRKGITAEQEKRSDQSSPPLRRAMASFS